MFFYYSFLCLFFLANQISHTHTHTEYKNNFNYNGSYFEFEDIEKFHFFKNEISQLSVKDFVEFEKEIGYNSIQGDYYKIFKEYAEINDRNEFDNFIEINQNKVTFINHDGLYDLQPLLPKTTNYIRRLISESRIIKIGNKIVQFTENFQFVYDEIYYPKLSKMINENKSLNYEEFNVTKYDLLSYSSPRNGLECFDQADSDHWTCNQIRLRGDYICGAFIWDGLIDPQFTFSSRSFGLNWPFWVPYRANNRVSADMEFSVTTSLGVSQTFMISVPLTVVQDDYLVEVVVSPFTLFPTGENGFWQINDEGESNHNLTRFTKNCEYDLDCLIVI